MCTYMLSYMYMHVLRCVKQNADQPSSLSELGARSSYSVYMQYLVESVPIYTYVYMKVSVCKCMQLFVI